MTDKGIAFSSGQGRSLYDVHTGTIMRRHIEVRRIEIVTGKLKIAGNRQSFQEDLGHDYRGTDIENDSIFT